jgi:hypothetical protein
MRPGLQILSVRLKRPDRRSHRAPHSDAAADVSVSTARQLPALQQLQHRCTYLAAMFCSPVPPPQGGALLSLVP